MATESIHKAKEKLSLLNSIRAAFGFDSNLCCEYTLRGKFKMLSFMNKPTAFCQLLKEYGFIEDFKPTVTDFYVIPIGEVNVELLEDFMYSFSQYQSIQFVAEFEWRQEMREEFNQAFRASYDAQQLTEIIN